MEERAYPSWQSSPVQFYIQMVSNAIAFYSLFLYPWTEELQHSVHRPSPRLKDWAAEVWLQQCPAKRQLWSFPTSNPLHCSTLEQCATRNERRSETSEVEANRSLKLSFPCLTLHRLLCTADMVARWAWRHFVYHSKSLSSEGKNVTDFLILFLMTQTAADSE